ncbi:hypothetical protein K2Q16_01900 [Patescibacteria group bacterium]|nr:hypothetical protein [Patescibacteria group bacterium]
MRSFQMIILPESDLRRLSFSQLAKLLSNSFPDDYGFELSLLVQLMRFASVPRGGCRAVGVTVRSAECSASQARLSRIMSLVELLVDDVGRLPFNRLLPVTCPLRLSAREGVDYHGTARLEPISGTYTVWLSRREFGLNERDLIVLEPVFIMPL